MHEMDGSRASFDKTILYKTCRTRAKTPLLIWRPLVNYSKCASLAPRAAVRAMLIPWTVLYCVSRDDDDDREFSKGLAQQYVDQAASTFGEMDEALCVRGAHLDGNAAC